MSRRLREQAILDLIETEPVSNQDTIADRLRERGIQATQATVSRDIKRLGLVKAPAGTGGYRYAAPAVVPRSTQRGRRQLKSACEQFVTKIELGGSLLVLKTLNGRANAVAVAARLLEESLTERITADLAELGESRLRENGTAGAAP